MMEEKITWDDARNKINFLAEDILAKIEWHYGENRAPFCYPPQYKRFNFLFFSWYSCIIIMEDGMKPYLFKNRNIHRLFLTVSEFLKTHFSPVSENSFKDTNIE